MRKTIRTAALGEQLEQRVRIAASLLAAYRIQAHVAPWDGTRCDLLVAHAGDEYGRRAMGLALRRGTPVVATVEPDVPAPGALLIQEATPAPELAKHFQELLVAAAARASTVGEAPVVAATAPAVVSEGVLPLLCRLADASLRGRRVEILHSGRRVTLCPREGRVFARTHSDLHAAREALGGTLWTVRPSDSVTSEEVSASLDSFLLLGAHRARDRLPAIEPGKRALRHWPDLGAVPELIDALRVARAMLSAPLEVEELADRCRIDARTVSAFLWAFSAADLVRQDGDARGVPISPSRPVAAGVREHPGLFAKIAARFGLAFRQPGAP